MKTGIHPAYNQITVTCACGNSFTTGSTLKNDFRVEICSHCHPLYTGKSNLIDTTGRVDRFKTRQLVAAQHAEAKAAKFAGKAPVVETAPEVVAEVAAE